MTSKEYLVDEDGDENFFENLDDAISHAQELADRDGFDVMIKEIHRYDIEEVVRLHKAYGGDYGTYAERIFNSFYDSTDGMCFDLNEQEPETSEEDWYAMIETWVRKHIKPQPESWWWQEVENVAPKGDN